MELTPAAGGTVVVIDDLAGVTTAGLVAALDALAYEDVARAVVLDLEGVPEEPALERAESEALAAVALPLVGAWGGAVAGRALDLGLACDIRVCSDAATFDGGLMGSRRQVAILGEAGCTRLLQAGGRAGAMFALELGLVSRVAAAGIASRELALNVATTIARRGPIATRLAKEAVWRGVTMPLPQALRFETDLTLLLQTTKDRAEGVHAFLEKREPQFTGD